MTRKQKQRKHAKRRYHRADSTRKYWVKHGQPRSVMEMTNPKITIHPDKLGFNIPPRSPYIPFSQFIQTLFPITPMRVKG